MTARKSIGILFKHVTEAYRSGHNEAVLKTVWVQAHRGSNPFASAIDLAESGTQRARSKRCPHLSRRDGRGEQGCIQCPICIVPSYADAMIRMQNRPQNAAMAQQVEHFLGKEEVTGSNPVSSSTQKAHHLMCFLFVLAGADLNFSGDAF